MKTKVVVTVTETVTVTVTFGSQLLSKTFDIFLKIEQDMFTFHVRRRLES